MAYSVRRKLFYTDFTNVASVGTAYSTSKVHTLDVGSSTSIDAGMGEFKFKLSELGSLFMELSSISGATEITVRVCYDSDGDKAIWAEATGTIMAGITDSTKGSVSIHGLSYPAGHPIDQSNNSLYVFYKTDAGTVSVDSCVLTLLS